MATGVRFGTYNTSDGFSGSVTLLDNEATVTGTFTEQPEANAILQFPKDEAKGYYLPIRLQGIKGQVVKRKDKDRQAIFGQTGDTNTTMVLILAVDPASPTTTLTVYSTEDDATQDSNGLDVTINCEGCEFNRASMLPMEQEDLQTEVGSHTASDLIGEDFSTSINEKTHTITATGELKEITDLSEEFPEESKITNYYLPVKLQATTGSTLKYDNLLGEPKTDSFESETKVAVFPIDPANPTRTFTIVAPTRVANEVTYTINASKCTLENFTPKQPVNLIIATTTIADKPIETWGTFSLEEKNITGTAKYVTGLYSSEQTPERNQGYYAPITCSPWFGTTFRVKRSGSWSDWQSCKDDGDILIWLGDGSIVATDFEIKSPEGIETAYTLNVVAESQEEEQPQVLSVKAAGQEQSFKGVVYSDLMSADTEAKLSDKTINITGTLYKFTGDQLGTGAKDKNCAVINIAVNKEGIVVKSTKIDNSEFTFTYNGKTADDFVMVFDEEHKSREFTFYLDQDHKDRNEGGVTYTVDASQATFETRTKAEATAEPLLTRVEIPGQDEGWKNAKYSDLMSPDTSAKLEGNKIEITGTLYRYDGWQAFGTDLQNKNYLVLTLVGAKEGVVMKYQKINGKDGNYTYPGDDLELDLVIPVDESHKEIVITFYPNASDAESGSNGQKYTVDFNKATISPDTKSPE